MVHLTGTTNPRYTGPLPVSSNVHELTESGKPHERKVPPMTTPTYITVDAAAKTFGVSSMTIRRWLDLGRLTKYQIGHAVRVDLNELHRVAAGGDA